jgi:Holin of 3TMs, for gene-transfer release
MNPLLSLLTNPAGIGQLFKDIVSAFKLPPEKEAELAQLATDHQFELQKLAAQYQQQLVEQEEKETEIAGQNIRAETQSPDKFTSRARPSFIYTMLGIFVFNYVIFPLLNRKVLDYPEALFWLFGSCMLGYTGARSWEKYQQVKFGPK